MSTAEKNCLYAQSKDILVFISQVASHLGKENREWPSRDHSIPYSQLLVNFLAFTKYNDARNIVSDY